MSTEIPTPRTALTTRQRTLLAYVAEMEPTTRRALATKMKSAVNTVGVHLNALRVAGVVRCEGHGRSAVWYIGAAPDMLQPAAVVPQQGSTNHDSPADYVPPVGGEVPY